MATPTLAHRTLDDARSIESLESPRNAPSIISPNQLRIISLHNHFFRVVVEKHNKRLFLLSLPLAPSATSRDVMQEVWKIKTKQASRFRVLRLLKQGLWTTVMEIATISTFQQANLGTQANQRPVEVIVASRTLSQELTAAFHRSQLLRSPTPFADQYPALLSTSPLGAALLIGQQIDKQTIFWILLMALLLSLALGLTVGFVYARVDLGVGITAGLTGTVSVLTALSVWMLK